MGAELFDVDGQMDGQSSRTHYSLFENVWGAWYRSLCYIRKIFIWHRLSFAGIEAADFENKVTIVVNCYYVGLSNQECYKTGVSECYCVEEFVRI